MSLRSSVEYCSISNVNSLYQCSCKQCCAIAVYALCYFVINLCGYWTSRTLSAIASNGNTLYNVMVVKRHIMPVYLPKNESIGGAEINLTLCPVSNSVLCCSLAESKSVLKMCMDHCSVRLLKHVYKIIIIIHASRQLLLLSFPTP